MKIKLLLRAATLLAATMFAASALAQTPITGRVVDAGNGTALAGALVTNNGTGDVAISSNDGSFTIRSRSGEQQLVITYLGFDDLELLAAAGGNLGDVEMQPDAISVQDIVVTAGIVTNDRLTPVAISNVTKAQLDMKLSSQELPEILKSTPSVYATKGEYGGYGDSRINIRGFDTSNIGVLINGVPVNGMENGRVYFSNWSGLSDVISFMQVQRGLGASKLGLSTVGGTINYVTRSTDAEKGGSVYYGIGNDGYQKLTFTVSTGLMDNGWALTLLGGRTSGDGYIRGTNFEAWNYFGNLSKVIGDGRHRLSLTAFGSPQWHNQRGGYYSIEDFKTHPDGRRMNRNFGYLNGKVKAGGYGQNVYHKPQISLVHTWNIDEVSMLSTTIYASISTGGGLRSYGPNSQSSGRGGSANWLNNSGGSSGNGKPFPETALTPDGHLNFDWVYEQNRNSVDGSAKAIMAMDSNAHNWYGILSSYNNQITDNIKITAGFDGRYYKGFHYTEITDLLGADYYLDNRIKYRDPNQPLYVGDKIQYDEFGEVTWAGVFVQAEYLKDNFSAFLSGSVSGNFYRWTNDGEPYANSNEPDSPLTGKTTSKWVTFLPWSVKGGAAYKLGQNHSVFANAGYFTRAPFFNSVFDNYTIKTNDEATTEKVATFEAGYTFANNVFNATVNGYYTLWLDKGYTRSLMGEQVYLHGINARHMGLELEATYRPSTRFSLKGMASVGDWIWRDDVEYTVYDENQNVLGTDRAFIAGVHVGDSAQITAALGVDWSPFRNVRVGADGNWFGKNFAQFQPYNRTNPIDKRDAWQLPDYWTIDLSLSYRFDLGQSVSATVYGNVNNLLDTWYISDARDGNDHDARTSYVAYGYGRTWTAGLKFNF